MSAPTPRARRGVGALLRTLALALAMAFAVGFGIGTWLRCRMERAPSYIGAAPRTPATPVRAAGPSGSAPSGRARSL